MSSPLRGISASAATSVSSGAVMSVGRNAVTPVSSSASPARAVAVAVRLEEVDAAEAVHLQVDEAGRGDAASVAPLRP